MSPEDRELLFSLRRQQQDLQQSLERLNAQLEALEARVQSVPFAEPVSLPPLPPPRTAQPELPPLPSPVAVAPLGSTPPPPPVPVMATAGIPLPPLPPKPKVSFEFQLGRWLTRIGAVLFVLLLVSLDESYHLHNLLGAYGKIGLMGGVSVILIRLGLRMERNGASLRIYGRTIMAAGLAGLYFTFYAAHYVESLKILHSPVLAGVLLLFWSGYVLMLAERKRSELLSLFAILLAYFSSAINPVTGFTMVANLLLALTAVIFLLRNGWASLSYLSLLGTYLIMLRQLVLDEYGEVVLDTSRMLSFWPPAIYLIGAWIIFTAPVLLSTAPSFRGGYRLAFMSLNNGALAVLLALTAYIAGYDYGATGRTVLMTGFLLLVVSIPAGWGWNEAEARNLRNAYLAQGLALLTGGIMMVYNGVSRGFLLALETLFLGWAGVSSRNLVLIIAAYVAAFLATLFLVWQIAVNAHHPWLLGVGGMAIMFANAWWARRDAQATPETRTKIVLASSYYCVLALGLLFTSMSTQLSDSALPPALALATLAFTFSVYFFPLYELPPVAQTLLVVAQGLVLFPSDTGESLSRGSTITVAAVTLLIITWWSRQRVTRYGPWIIVLNCIYALALVGLTYHAVRPYASLQGWIISASLLSVAFLVWGAFTRVWPLAIMGQVFLIVALYHFFLPPGGWDASPFPYKWGTMAVPIVVVFSIGRAIHVWLRVFREITGATRDGLRRLAYFYQGLSLALLIRAISALVPPLDQIATFLLLSTFLLAWNVCQGKTFGIRCSFALHLVGVLLYLQHFGVNDQSFLATYLNGVAIFFFLCQPGLLRFAGPGLVTKIESWCLVVLSALLGWFFVSSWALAQAHLNYLTMSWALYALFLFLFGLLTWERRVRWCGLVILSATLVRGFVLVLFSDTMGLSNSYRLITLMVLTIITLGLGYIYARFGEKLKDWL